MAIETIGKYQLQLIALEAPSGKGWDPFVSIYKFDDDKQDFQTVVEKRPASDQPLPSYEVAIEQARRIGNELILAGKL